MPSLRSAIALALVLSTSAWADTIRGQVAVVRESKPGATGGTVLSAQVQTARGQAYRISDPDAADLLGHLQGEQVVLEGSGTPEAFTVSRIVEPEFVLQMTGVLSTDKPGVTGRRRIQCADGSEADVSGPNFLMLYSLSKLGKRELTFSAFKLLDARGALRKLVVMEVEARTLEGVVLSDPAAYTLFKIVVPPLLFVMPPKIHGQVPAGETVWIQRRSLLGASVLIRDAQNVAGFVGWDELQIGRLLEDPEVAAEPEPAQPQARQGAVDTLGALGR